MNFKLSSAASLGAFILLSSLHAEVSFQTVARTGQTAPGLTNTNFKFSSFEYLSLADDGRLAFTGYITGPGVTISNNLALWAGLPDELQLLTRAGDSFPGSTNEDVLSYVRAPNIDNHQAVGFVAYTKKQVAEKLGALVFKHFAPAHFFGFNVIDMSTLPDDLDGLDGDDLLSDVVNAVASRVELSGPGIEPGDFAIVAGPPTNIQIVARIGFPAPGFNGNFADLLPDSRALALAEDGNVAFIASAYDGGNWLNGIWFGKAGSLQLVTGNGPAPDSLLGPGYNLGSPTANNVEVNNRGEVAFATRVAGPGLNATNFEFVVAGKPGYLRVIAQSGQPAPGVPGAYFQSYPSLLQVFRYALLGADGTVAFVASYSDTGSDNGAWLAPTNGATPILIMRNGQQAPGCPVGVKFATNSFIQPPFDNLYMNSRNQIVFSSKVAGPGVGYTNEYGIWMAEPDGQVNLIARAGDMLDIGGGVMRQTYAVSFGTDPETIAGPEDGRRCPINDRGEVLFAAGWQNPPGPPDFGSYGFGLFVARTGLSLSAEKVGTDLHLSFPTLLGKHYRVDYTDALPPPTTWPVLEPAVTGTGNEVTVTDTDAIAVGSHFYRVVRTD